MSWAVAQANKVWLEAIPDEEAVGALLKAQIADVAKRAHRERKQEAATLGTAVHTALEYWHEQREAPPFISEAVEARFQVAIEWLQKQESQPVAVERRIYSRKHSFVGTLDKLFLVRGKLTLLDWKTSKGIWPEFRFQTAAYVGAYEEETGERVAQRCLVRLGEDGTLEPHWFNRTSFHKDYSAFLGALKLYKRLQEIKGEDSA